MAITSRTTTAPPDTIGNYRIIREIGRGAFGRISQVEHVLLGERACLKQNLEADPAHVELLRQEARLLWNLSEYHSIPSAKDFVRIDHDIYGMVMSYIEGETLADIVASKGRLHPEDASWVTERLLGALYYCHYNGIIHSDVKPENVFVEPRKHDIKLIDFGLAACSPSSGSSPIGYTPMYAAPELLAGTPPLPETDIYGAGIVMLHALGGDVRAHTFPDDTPTQIKEFCTRLINYDPMRRPNWEKEDIIASLSDARFAAFGRRHRGR